LILFLGDQGDTLKETEESQDVLYMLLLLLQACRSSGLIFTSSCLSNVPISGPVSSNEKVAPNKAANSLDWGTGKVQASLKDQHARNQ